MKARRILFLAMVALLPLLASAQWTNFPLAATNRFWTALLPQSPVSQLWAHACEVYDVAGDLSATNIYPSFGGYQESLRVTAGVRTWTTNIAGAVYTNHAPYETNLVVAVDVRSNVWHGVSDMRSLGPYPYVLNSVTGVAHSARIDLPMGYCDRIYHALRNSYLATWLATNETFDSYLTTLRIFTSGPRTYTNHPDSIPTCGDPTNGWFSIVSEASARPTVMGEASFIPNLIASGFDHAAQNGVFPWGRGAVGSTNLVLWRGHWETNGWAYVPREDGGYGLVDVTNATRYLAVGNGDGSRWVNTSGALITGAVTRISGGAWSGRIIGALDHQGENAWWTNWNERPLIQYRPADSNGTVDVHVHYTGKAAVSDYLGGPPTNVIGWYFGLSTVETNVHLVGTNAVLLAEPLVRLDTLAVSGSGRTNDTVTVWWPSTPRITQSWVPAVHEWIYQPFDWWLTARLLDQRQAYQKYFTMRSAAVVVTNAAPVIGALEYTWHGYGWDTNNFTVSVVTNQGFPYAWAESCLDGELAYSTTNVTGFLYWAEGYRSGGLGISFPLINSCPSWTYAVRLVSVTLRGSLFNLDNPPETSVIRMTWGAATQDFSTSAHDPWSPDNFTFTGSPNTTNEMLIGTDALALSNLIGHVEVRITNLTATVELIGPEVNAGRRSAQIAMAPWTPPESTNAFQAGYASHKRLYLGVGAYGGATFDDDGTGLQWDASNRISQTRSVYDAGTSMGYPIPYADLVSTAVPFIGTTQAVGWQVNGGFWTVDFAVTNGFRFR